MMSALLVAWLFLNSLSILVSVLSVFAAFGTQRWCRRMWLGATFIVVAITAGNGPASELARMYVIQAILVFSGVIVLARVGVGAKSRPVKSTCGEGNPRFQFSLCDLFCLVVMSAIFVVVCRSQQNTRDLAIPFGFALIGVGSSWCVYGRVSDTTRRCVFALGCIIASAVIQTIQRTELDLAVVAAVISMLQGVLLVIVFWTQKSCHESEQESEQESGSGLDI